MSSCCQSCNTSGWPTSLPSGTRQTCWINAMTSSALTLSSRFGLCGLRLTTLDLPRTPFGSLQDSRTRSPRYSARLRRGPQLRQQISDGFRRQTVPGRKRTSLLAVVLALRTQIANLNLKALRNRDLGSKSTKNQPTGGVDPMRRQRSDNLAPSALFLSIQLRRRFRTTCAGDQCRDDGKRSWRPITATRHRGFPSRWIRREKQGSRQVSSNASTRTRGECTLI